VQDIISVISIIFCVCFLTQSNNLYERKIIYLFDELFKHLKQDKLSISFAEVIEKIIGTPHWPICWFDCFGIHRVPGSQVCVPTLKRLILFQLCSTVTIFVSIVSSHYILYHNVWFKKIYYLAIWTLTFRNHNIILYCAQYYSTVSVTKIHRVIGLLLLIRIDDNIK